MKKKGAGGAKSVDLVNLGEQAYRQEQAQAQVYATIAIAYYVAVQWLFAGELVGHLLCPCCGMT